MAVIVRGIREGGLTAIERALELNGVNPVRFRCHLPGVPHPGGFYLPILSTWPEYLVSSSFSVI